jgi:nicotinate-nucleotide pyrophosphorylase (carboxylating)
MQALIREALKEDIGKEDITTGTLVPEKNVKAVLVAKEPCVVCGLAVARMTFKLLDRRIKFKPRVHDGQKVKKGKALVFIQGPASGILRAERVALNFLSLLSGVATMTRKFMDAARPHKVRIIDTRKTLPGLRILEKYAVRIGGGYNHRFKLDEMIMVKDNHLRMIGGVTGLRGKWRGLRKSGKLIEIEVNNLDEFRSVLNLNPDVIMLDNMSPQQMRKAVLLRNKFRVPHHPHSKIRLEASGGVNLKNIRKVAATGVDGISIGSLTHSVDSVDISLEIV